MFGEDVATGPEIAGVYGREGEVIPVGSGMPSWLDTTTYLAADETRALPSVRLGGFGVCLICGQPPGPPTFALEGAHIATKQAGGRRKGKDGPQAECCWACHQGPGGLHSRGDRCLAVRRDTGEVVLLTNYGDEKKLARPVRVGV